MAVAAAACSARLQALATTRFASPPLLPQVLHWIWLDNARLWLLATPAACFAALEVGAVVEAAQACRHAPRHPPAGASWLAAHYEAAVLALAALNTAALAAATFSLLAAAAGLGAGGPTGEEAEALLGEEGGAGPRRRKARQGKRMRLIHGTLRYLVPDTPQLKLR